MHEMPVTLPREKRAQGISIFSFYRNCAPNRPLQATASLYSPEKRGAAQVPESQRRLDCPPFELGLHDSVIRNKTRKIASRGNLSSCSKLGGNPPRLCGHYYRT